MNGLEVRGHKLSMTVVKYRRSYDLKKDNKGAAKKEEVAPEEGNKGN